MQYIHGDKGVEEFSLPGASWRADVALINNGKPRIIFEIKATHASKDRPGITWFEFDAVELLLKFQLIKDSMELNCIRPDKPWKCKACIAASSMVLSDLTKFEALTKAGTKQDNYIQPKPCIICKLITYRPVFNVKYRAICRTCYNML
jgi:hypothetical protein